MIEDQSSDHQSCHFYSPAYLLCSAFCYYQLCSSTAKLKASTLQIILYNQVDDRRTLSNRRRRRGTTITRRSYTTTPCVKGTLTTFTYIIPTPQVAMRLWWCAKRCKHSSHGCDFMLRRIAPSVHIRHPCGRPTLATMTIGIDGTTCGDLLIPNTGTYRRSYTPTQPTVIMTTIQRTRTGLARWWVYGFGGGNDNQILKYLPI